MDSSDKVDSHNDKITENNTTGNQSGNNKSSQQDVENKEEVNQQTE